MTEDRPPQPEENPPGMASPGAASATEPPPLTAFAWRNRLVRPTHGRLLAGVCGALGRATNTDPVLWRVIIAVLTVFGGIGILAYLLGWLLLPSDGDTATPVEAVLGRGTSGTSAVLTIIAGIVALLSLGAFVSEPFRPGLLGAALLGGALLLLLRDGRGRARPAGTAAAPPVWPAQPPMWSAPGPSAGMPPGPAGATQASSDPPTSGVKETPLPPQPPFGAPPSYAPPPYTQGPYGPQPFAPRGPFAGGPPPPPPPTRPFVPPPPPLPKAPRSRLGRLTFSLILVVVGALVAVDLVGPPIPGGAYFAAALGTVALGLIIGAWFGRARGLIALGIILSVALASVASVDRFDRGWRGGSVTWVPTSLSQVQSSYRQDVGDVRLDLTKVDFASSSTPVNITVRVDLGSLSIVLPPNVDAVIDAHVDVGDASVLGESWSGLGLDARTVSDDGADGTGGGELHITASVDVGNLEVDR